MTSCCASWVWQTRSASTPAATARAAALPGPKCSLIAFISRQSLTQTPSKPTSPRRSEMAGALIVAATPGSSASKTTCVVITHETPAFTAALKGTSSHARSRSSACASRGRS